MRSWAWRAVRDKNDYLAECESAGWPWPGQPSTSPAQHSSTLHVPSKVLIVSLLAMADSGQDGQVWVDRWLEFQTQVRGAGRVRFCD